MADLRERMALARRRVDVDWSTERSRAAEIDLGRRRVRRARARAGVAVLTVAAAIVAIVVFVHPGATPRSVVVAPSSAPVPSAAPLAAGAERIALADGSVVRPFADSDVRPRAVTATAVDVEVIHGGAAFDVAPNPNRLFSVKARDVTVLVIGTAFSVEEVGAKVVVAVERGKVRVRWGDHQRELVVGERGVFPPDEAGDAPDAGSDVGDGTDAGAESASSRPSWHALAKAGDYDKAYEALHVAGEHTVRDVPDELLLAADVARLSGHPAQAVDPLRRVARDHRGDPRAALAAFTLGRVLLDSLGRPRDAADAFADARALGGGGLGEEALAREVEARSRAGDSERARTLALEYVAQFPDGKRTRSVKKFGGLE